MKDIIRYSVICDYVSVSREGKLNLIGVFDNLSLDKLPAIHDQMYIVSSFIFNEQPKNISLVLMQEDAVIGTSKFTKKQTPTGGSHVHVWNVKKLKIANTSPIELQIFINGEHAHSNAINVSY